MAFEFKSPRLGLPLVWQVEHSDASGVVIAGAQSLTILFEIDLVAFALPTDNKKIIRNNN